jgi:uncharacterized membrane protein YfhO
VVYRDPLAVITRDDAALPMARVVRPGRAPAAARTLTREPDHVVVQTAAGPAGRLVLADVAYPGWQVRVDGHEATPRIQDGLLRAVDLPAGRHRVEWTFAPRSIRLGLAISLLAAGILVAAAAASLVRRRAVRAG